MNLKAFPFFESLQGMKQACKHGVYLISPGSQFLPFQIVKAHDGQPIDCINVFHAKTDVLYRTIMGNELDYDFHTSPLQDYITYYGAPFAATLDCGDYYIEIGGRYSAIFSVADSVTGLLKVEWLNSSNLIDTSGTPLVIYQTAFMQRVYLGAEVTSPTYPYQETGNENSYKEFLADFKRVIKQSQFTTLKLPEYLVDALGSLPIHDYVNVGAYNEVKEVEVTPNWIDFGTGASVKVAFSESSPVIAMGCGEVLELEAFNVEGYSPRGMNCGQPDSGAYWEATGTVTCEQVAGSNTGYTLLEQVDTNPTSATYNQTRTVTGTLNTTRCPVPVTYWNDDQSAYVQRNNCQAGYTGSVVLVRVAANTYSSTISKLDANNKALAQLNSIKQDEANSYGVCEPDMGLVYAGNISDSSSTNTQACFMLSINDAFTETGAMQIGDVVYMDAKGSIQPAPNKFYKVDDNYVVRISDTGTITSITTCSGDINK